MLLHQEYHPPVFKELKPWPTIAISSITGQEPGNVTKGKLEDILDTITDSTTEQSET